MIHVNPGQRSSGGNPGSVAYLIGLEHPDAGDVDVLDRAVQRVRGVLGPGLELGVLRGARGGDPRGPDPAVTVVLLDGDQTVRLERAQEPAEVSRVEVEAGAQVSAGSINTFGVLEVEALISQVDAGLYAAKAQGRNRVLVS